MYVSSKVKNVCRCCPWCRWTSKVGGPSSEWWDECVLRLKRPVKEMLRIYVSFKKIFELFLFNFYAYCTYFKCCISNGNMSDSLNFIPSFHILFKVTSHICLTLLWGDLINTTYKHTHTNSITVCASGRRRMDYFQFSV